MSKYQDPKVGIDARELVKHTFKVTSNTNNFPKKYRLTLVSQIVNTSMEIYNNIVDANNTFDIASRIKYQQQAISECRKFRGYLDIALEVCHPQCSINHWATMANQIETQLMNWKKSTEKYLK